MEHEVNQDILVQLTLKEENISRRTGSQLCQMFLREWVNENNEETINFDNMELTETFSGSSVTKTLREYFEEVL